MFLGYTPQYWLFFAIGLAILVYEGHRQYNRPVYSKTEEDRRDWLSTLKPSDIRDSSAFFSSELIYLSILILLFLSFSFSDTVRQVIFFIVNFIGSSATIGGEVPSLANETQLPAVGVDELAKTSKDFTDPATPFLTSVTMVTALRFPLIRRIEVLIRAFALQLFGIPNIPNKRRIRFDQTPISIEEVEAELPPNTIPQSYKARIAKFSEASLKLGIQIGDIRNLEKDLSKLAAYQIWVGDLGIWPTDDLKGNFLLYRELNEPLLKGIDQLFRDLNYLLLVEMSGSASDETAQKMRQELWETKAKYASDLTASAVDMMTLFEQKSGLPERDAPGSLSLRKFIKKVRAIDEVRVAQINLAIILILACVVANAAFGALHATWLKAIALEIGIVTTENVGLLGKQIDVMSSALIWALSAFIAYGLSVWIALWYRQKQYHADRWKLFFDPRNNVPPMLQILKLAAMLMVLVTMAYLCFSQTQIKGWSLLGERDAEWWRVLEGQLIGSLKFAAAGTIHAISIVLIMDLAEARRGWGTWVGVILFYVVVMAIAGAAIGLLAAMPTTPVEITNMRIRLYATDLSLIALTSSLWLIIFLNDRQKKAADNEILNEVNP